YGIRQPGLHRATGGVGGLFPRAARPGHRFTPWGPATGSGAVATLPLGLEGAWVDEQIALLDAVRKQWPSEVLESSYGVFEWKKS
ncbi:hypothetical protein ACFW9D_04450, partial [Streptomyces sp. NPDC059524]